jgi:hypothetical protein
MNEIDENFWRAAAASWSFPEMREKKKQDYDRMRDLAGSFTSEIPEFDLESERLSDELSDFLFGSD